jgi:hypothetical protein
VAVGSTGSSRRLAAHVTLTGAGHLVHDLASHREEFFTIVDEFVGGLTS